jgi:hypothetical protein
MKRVYRLPGAMIVSIWGLFISGCAPGQITGSPVAAGTDAGQPPALADTAAPTVKPIPTLTRTPEIFRSADTDLYDNFNDSHYDGSVNEGLWNVADQDAGFVLQRDGFLSIHKQKDPDECLVAAANNFRGIVPVTPFFVQADLKVEKQVSNGSAGFYTVGTANDRGFMSSCSLVLESPNQLVGVCVNHWWDGNNKENPVSEHYATKQIPINYAEWHTFRIDYDPRGYLFTYFVDNENVGSYQVVDADSIRKAAFELDLDVCLAQGSGFRGDFDNVRIGMINP